LFFHGLFIEDSQINDDDYLIRTEDEQQNFSKYDQFSDSQSEQMTIETENLEESIVPEGSLSPSLDVINIIQEQQQPCSQNPTETVSTMNEFVYLVYYIIFISIS
jgi:hypothetical protein